MWFRCSGHWDGVTRTFPKAPIASSEAPTPTLPGSAGEGDSNSPSPAQRGGVGVGASAGGAAVQPHLWLMAAYGFVAGLPLPLSGFTFRLWLSEGGVSLAVIGLTANIGLAYSLKFLWAPVLDNARPPGPLRGLGRRRGWLAVIQPALAVAAALLALSDPARLPLLSLAFAALVAFCSASQDIVVDAWRIEA